MWRKQRNPVMRTSMGINEKYEIESGETVQTNNKEVQERRLMKVT